MAIYNHVEVRVFLDGQPLHEHEYSEESSLHSRGKREEVTVRKYVESKLGANLELEFKVNADFKFEGGDCLDFAVSTDGGSEC